MAPIRKSAKRWLTCCTICGVLALGLGGCIWLIVSPIMVNVIVQLNFLTGYVRRAPRPRAACLSRRPPGGAPC